VPLRFARAFGRYRRGASARKATGITGSIGSVGDALDNALMESTIGLYKTELIDRHDRSWTGRAEVERETASWVHWFNSTRLHSSTTYLPPVEYERAWRAAQQEAA